MIYNKHINPNYQKDYLRVDYEDLVPAINNAFNTALCVSR